MPVGLERRFLFYSHDGVGLGHARRNLAIAAAIKNLAPDASILLACGTAHVERCRVSAAVDFLKLPELRKITNEAYASRRLGVPQSDIVELRSSLLKAAVLAFRPQVMLVDKHPLGVCRELCPALEVLRASGGRAILGLRDILDDEATVMREWFQGGLLEWIPRYYERVLVYGQRELYDPIARYRFPSWLADCTQFCGYIVGSAMESQPGSRDWIPHGDTADRPLVLATAGGGEDGFFLLRSFIEAARGVRWQGVAIAGPLMSPEQQARLRRLATRAGVWFEDSVADLPGMLRWADAVVAMGGYNTLAEVLARGLPVVCVPRTQPRVEQLIRALTFERAGLLQAARPDELSIEGLRERVESALRISRRFVKNRVKAVLDFSGAKQAALHLLAPACRAEVERPVTMAAAN